MRRVRSCWWVDQDAKDLKLPRKTWNPLIFGAGFFGLLVVWTLPIFLISFAFLTTLPVTLLEPSLDLLETLERWGIRRFHELAALPPLGIAERLGSEGLRLRELARRKALSSYSSQCFTWKLLRRVKARS